MGSAINVILNNSEGENLMTQAEKEKVLSVKELIDYQDGAIVSRGIIGEKFGKVLIFAFDKGEELSDHTSPYDALAYIIEGETEISVRGKRSSLTEGQAIIMPANIPHAVYPKNKLKMLLVLIKE
ncbi:MAG: cupin domain-containing protein [Candidatus Omnitrophica bacterium]|nr:cupin domain-containing protein [Candidatus Omnitrophota bacterium]